MCVCLEIKEDKRKPSAACAFLFLLFLLLFSLRDGVGGEEPFSVLSNLSYK